MDLHEAQKIIIITEKLLAQRVCKVIDACGATGYTLIEAGGKGSRDIRSRDRASVVDGFDNVKIEVIVNDKAQAKHIMDEVTERYFSHYSGICYVESVAVLRPMKFGLTQSN